MAGDDGSGFVYIMSNEAMPGLVKIGRTKNHPLQRARELCTTGVPEPFHLEHAAWFGDAGAAERDMHEHFAHRRVPTGREFFAVECEDAIERLMTFALCSVDRIRHGGIYTDQALKIGLKLGIRPEDFDVLADYIPEHAWVVARARLFAAMSRAMDRNGTNTDDQA